jgi:amino acid adenylation domain-containing protein
MTVPQVEDVYELSPMQQGILFHTLYETAGDLYVEQCVVSLRGDLDRGLFERAWRTAVRRHTILRTSFHWEGLEKPVQVVHPEADLPFEFHDWRTLSEASRDERLQEFLASDRAKGFDLAVAPLLRVSVFRTGADAAECVLTFQHLLLDRWSRFLLLNEVVASYGRAEDPLPPARPFGDYIAWVQEQDLRQAEAFWKRTLAGYREPGQIPGDGSGDGTSSPRATRAGVRMSEDDTSALQAYARGNRLTLNTVLQGAWAVLMSRYGGGDDVIFGTTVSGRPPALTGVERMVGLFINTLPVRVRLPGARRVSDFLSDLQSQLLEMREYEHSSLIDIQGWSEVPRGLPLFHSLVVFENTGDGPEAARGARLAMTGVRSVGGATNFPLTVFAMPGERFSFAIQSNSTLFSDQALSRMADHLGNILRLIAARPGASLDEVSPLSEPERARLLVEWNETDRDYPPACVHEVFEITAAGAPESLAARFEGASIDYRTLNARANQIAHRLIGLGVGSDERVLLCVERSVEMLAALLGILKAGAAYVPLDPGYPMERLAFMMADSKASALITERGVLGRLPDFDGPVILLDRDRDALEAQPTRNPDAGAKPNHLAYVIYTSGSTGTPKGVAVEHHSLTNLLRAMQERIPLASDDVMLAVTTLSFDIAGLELYLPLCAGATVALVSRERAADGHALREEIRRVGATVMQATPITWQLLRAAGWVGDGLRTVLCGGEALSRELANELLATGLAVWNVYGPTETTIWSTAHRIDGPVVGATAPIGRPIANTRIYVLDGRGEPVPEGVAGELFIGGAGVARGYWNLPDLTAERFPVLRYETGRPFGGRAYRTGDSVRYRSDGTLEFLGRMDAQIKIRGFRIELGEIEAVLRQEEGVADAVVAAREDPAAGTRLVAYLVAPGGRSAPVFEELRARVSRKLPDYMIPSAWVSIDRVPLTPNGKVDRRALPDPDQGRPELASFIEPRSPVEEGLADIWRDILRVDRVGAQDDFFHLGGHSLLATRLISRIAETFGIRLPLREIFEHSRLDALAGSLARAMVEDSSDAEIQRMLAEVQGLSDEEAGDRLLSKENGNGRSGTGEPPL